MDPRQEYYCDYCGRLTRVSEVEHDEHVNYICYTCYIVGDTKVIKKEIVHELPNSQEVKK